MVSDIEGLHIDDILKVLLSDDCSERLSKVGKKMAETIDNDIVDFLYLRNIAGENWLDKG